MHKVLRIIKFALQGFFRNFWLSVVTITLMLMAVISVTLLIGVDYIKQAAIRGVEQKVDILVEMNYEVAAEDVENFVIALEDLQEVKRTKIITPEQNMELFKQSNASSDIKKVLDIFEEDENPFAYSVAIQAYNLEQYSVILDFVGQDQYTDLVKESTFHDYEAFISSISGISETVNRYSWYIILIFVLISIIVIFNTIRISIYSRKSEITIMKLVGAGNWFIRTPFLLESVFYALVAVLIVIAVVYPVVNILQPSLTNYFQDTQVINLAGYFQNNFVQIFVVQFLVLSVLNIFSTAMAIRKYLKV